MNQVAVLFAQRGSLYHDISGCDVYDIDRDALSYFGSDPVIAHPPCRGWGGLRHMAKPRPGELDLAIYSICECQRVGGVLEHPVRSALWQYMGLPVGPQVDVHGGFTLTIDQFWFGHLCQKRTNLYICGTDRRSLPVMSFALGDAPCVIATNNQSRKSGNTRPELRSTKDREATPEKFAFWLRDVAELCRQ